MALETLTAAQAEAARLMEINYNEIKEAQRPTLYRLGMIALDGVGEFPAYRSHSGPRGIGKGGIRLANYPTLEAAEATVEELSVEMLFKPYLRGYKEYKGAKGLIVADAASLDHRQKLEVARQYENLMENAGLVDYRVDVPAGDVGTNGLATEYALERQRRHPDDAYWQAVITGKAPEFGGLEPRSAATGREAYIAQLTLMDAQGETMATDAMQGFGNGGAWFAYFASNDPSRRIFLPAIGEREGVLSTNHPEGLIITRAMVALIGDNLAFRGPKLLELAKMIERNQPDIELHFDNDPTSIIRYPADYFAPAALGDVLRDDNVDTLGARKGVAPIANGFAKGKALKRMVERNLLVPADYWFNGGGVDVSIKEHRTNIAMVEGTITEPPSNEQVEQEADESTRTSGRRILRMAEVLETNDLGVATAAVSMGEFAVHNGITIDREFRELVAA